jgi:hypothetical protein
VPLNVKKNSFNIIRMPPAFQEVDFRPIDAASFFQHLQSSKKYDFLLSDKSIVVMKTPGFLEAGDSKVGLINVVESEIKTSSPETSLAGRILNNGENHGRLLIISNSPNHTHDTNPNHIYLIDTVIPGEIEMTNFSDVETYPFPNDGRLKARIIGARSHEKIDVNNTNHKQRVIRHKRLSKMFATPSAASHDTSKKKQRPNEGRAELNEDLIDEIHSFADWTSKRLPYFGGRKKSMKKNTKNKKSRRKKRR